MTDTTTEPTTAKRWSIVDVFGYEDEGHVCCSCCEGYCPHEDGRQAEGPEMLVFVGEYVSDRYVAVLRELVDVDEIPEGTTRIDHPAVPKGWGVPDEEPSASTVKFAPSRVLRLLRLGLDVREGGTSKSPQHLYLDGKHVGYIMPAPRGSTIPDAQDLDRTVRAMHHDVDAKLLTILAGIGGARVDALFQLREAIDESGVTL